MATWSLDSECPIIYTLAVVGGEMAVAYNL